jgi:hypothetical protein
MPEEKKARVKTPRSETHQSALDAVHEWLKKPFPKERNAMMAALEAHKRFMYDDDTVTL